MAETIVRAVGWVLMYPVLDTAIIAGAAYAVFALLYVVLVLLYAVVLAIVLRPLRWLFPESARRVDRRAEFAAARWRARRLLTVLTIRAARVERAMRRRAAQRRSW